jgi:hypothetical protein
MLGVPGNISSCTILHGIHLAILLSSFCCKVVGDDALGAGPIADDIGEFVTLLSNIGDVSMAKTEWWRPEREQFGDILQTWHYTKRPINRLDTRVDVGWQAVFPSICMMLNITDSFHTSTPWISQRSHMKKVAGMLTSFARQFEEHVLTEIEHEFCTRFLRTVVKRSGLEDFTTSSGDKLMFPRHIGREGFEAMMFEFRDTAKWLPVRADQSLYDEVEVNREVHGKMSKALRLAVDMGYGVAEQVRTLRIVGHCEDDIRDMVSGRFIPLYSYCLSFSCPLWLVRLIREASHTGYTVDTHEEERSVFDVEEM